MKFLRCEVCGKIVALVNDCSSCPTKCCGEPMKEIIPNTSDGAAEKHVPVVKVDGIVVFPVERFARRALRKIVRFIRNIYRFRGCGQAQLPCLAARVHQHGGDGSVLYKGGGLHALPRRDVQHRKIL